MLYKQSYYNTYYNINGETWIFNSFNLGLTSISSEILDILKQNTIDINSYPEDINKVLKELIKAGIIVNSAVDELKILQYIYNTDKYDKDYLSITILPTIECNCCCFYCFERENKHKTKKIGTASFISIEKDIISFIEKKISNAKVLSIAWFGGEPLLSFDIIEKLSGKLISLAEKHNVSYVASLTTNGYYLTDIPNIINRLKKCKISSFQITLDGAPSEHNRIRKLKSNIGNTFDKMLDGIILLHKNNLSVSVRINLNKLNVPNIYQLFDIFEKKKLKNIRLYFGQLIDYSNKDNSHIYLNENEYADIVSKLYTELRKRKFRYGLDDHYPTIARACVANRVDTAVIDCYGNIYKCRSQIGDYEKIIGNVCNINSQTELEAMREINWLEWTPFKYTECKKCKILPLCMGGCPYSLYDNDNAQPKCVDWKFNVDFFVQEKIKNLEGMK